MQSDVLSGAKLFARSAPDSFPGPIFTIETEKEKTNIDLRYNHHSLREKGGEKENEMFRKSGNGRSGFTLIEMMIVMVILGIFVAAVIPRYVDMVARSKESSAKGSLGGFRSAISIYYANEALTTGIATFPPIDSLRVVGVVMTMSIPKNPYQAESDAPDSIVTGVTKGVTVGARGGWAYKASTGEIWPNTNEVGEKDW